MRLADRLRRGEPPGADPLRFATSGLLQRSNKLMYDRSTESLFDQFAGRAVAGSRRGTELEMLPLTVTTWGAWKDEHPTTTILAEDPGTGRTNEADPLAGRDANGPIFPVGERADGLPAQQEVPALGGTGAGTGSGVRRTRRTRGRRRRRRRRGP